MTGPYAQAADRYRRLGWQGVLPVGLDVTEDGVSVWRPREKSSPPKGYTGRGGQWPDGPVVDRWIRHPAIGACNIAIRVPDGLVGVDVDHYDGKQGLVNLLAFQLQHDLSELPLAATVRSTSRGSDQASGIYWFRTAPDLRWVSDPCDDVEIVQHGHRYAIVWPSIHPNGSVYEWHHRIGVHIDPPSVDDARLLWLPDDWTEALTVPDDIPADHPPAAEHREDDWSDDVTRVHDLLVERLGTASDHEAARGMVMMLCRLEQQDHSGATAALDDAESRFVAAVTNPARGGQVRTGHAARSEWRRLLDGGRRKARTTDNPNDDTTWIGDQDEPLRDNGSADQDNIQAFKFADGQRPTDVGNAARLLTLAKGRLRYVHAWGKWIVYRHGRWIIDENDALVTEMAKQVARSVFRLAAKTANTDSDKAKPIWAWALKSETSGAVAAMVRLARGAPGVIVDHEQLDAGPWLLNVRNGTIDLRTGQLQAHDPADLCTLQAPVDYDPETRSTLWQTCVERWQPNPAVRRYIQLRAGAAGAGVPTETVDVDYGSGGNGKSKFWGAIQHVLGPYATVPHKSLLVTGRFEQHPTVVADLFRKRLAVASETSAADALDDESVKNLTGGDRLKGRRMRENPWEFQPTHTLVMFSNHRPAVRGRDEGVWRRLRLVPWEVTIPEDERDDGLATKLRTEAPGILAWVVNGARLFHTEGLTPPDAVRAATEHYRAEEDTVGRFIDDVLVIGDGWAYSTDIKAELDAWCDEQDVITPPRMNEVTTALKAVGCRDGGRRQVHGKRSTIWHGVRIAEIRSEAL